MADINRKRTVVGRLDGDFKKWVEEQSRFKSFQEKEKISPARITQAIFNLRKKYPIDEELKLSKLGKWKSK